MSQSSGHCTFCGVKINPDQDYRKVTGWERHRTQGGTNAIRLREVQPVWACRWCIDRQSRGVPPAQQSLV